MATELRARGADPSGFRSRRLTAEILRDTDLILTAETTHRDFIIDEWPAVFRRTFTLAQFADIATVVGVALPDRLMVFNASTSAAMARMAASASRLAASTVDEVAVISKSTESLTTLPLRLVAMPSVDAKLEVFGDSCLHLLARDQRKVSRRLVLRQCAAGEGVPRGSGRAGHDIRRCRGGIHRGLHQTSRRRPRSLRRGSRPPTQTSCAGPPRQ